MGRINIINIGTLQQPGGGVCGVGGLVSLVLVVVNGARHGMLLPKGCLTACHGIASLGLGLGLAYPGM